MDRIALKSKIFCVLYCLLLRSYAQDISRTADNFSNCNYNLTYGQDGPTDHHLTIKGPLIMGDNPAQLELLKPQEFQLLRIQMGQTVRLACTGENNGFQGIRNKQNVLAECEGGTFKIMGASYTKTELQCIKPNEAVLEKNLGSELACPQWAESYSIGYRIDSKAFLPLIKLCRNDDAVSTLYTKHTISAESQNFKDPARIIDFKTDDVYDKLEPICGLQWMYEKNEQGKIFKDLMKSPTLVNQYHNVPRSLYLNRGHLAPRTDFSGPHATHATYFYANTVPQYKKINAGKWAKLEFALTKYSEVNHVDLEVYTGAYGTLSFTDASQKLKPVWMCKKKTQEDGKLPVPGVLWKIVIDRKNQASLGFVVTNDPHTRVPSKLCRALNTEKATGPKWFFPVEGQKAESGLISECDPHELANNLGYKSVHNDLPKMTKYLEPVPKKISSRNVYTSASALAAGTKAHRLSYTKPAAM